MLLDGDAFNHYDNCSVTEFRPMRHSNMTVVQIEPCSRHVISSH